MEREEAAVIKSTSLGIEHGILTFSLNLEGAGWGQSYGGYALDTGDSDGPAVPRAGRLGLTAIREILELLDKGSWERLPGTKVRIVVDGQLASTRILRLGHATKSRWLDLREIFGRAV